MTRVWGGPRLAVLPALALFALAVPGAAFGAPGITLEQDPGEIQFGDSSSLSGQLTGVTGGNGGRTVALLASEYPYGSEAQVATVATNEAGAFSFPITPDLNTRYRARFDGGILLGTAVSSVEQVWVYARGTSSDLRVVGRRAKMSFRLLYSPDIEPDPLAGKKAYWYFRKTSQSHFRRVQTSPLRPLSGDRGGIRSKLNYRLPLSRRPYRFQVFPCLKAPPRDIGLGDKRPGTCPRKIPHRKGQSRGKGTQALSLSGGTQR